MLGRFLSVFLVLCANSAIAVDQTTIISAIRHLEDQGVVIIFSSDLVSDELLLKPQAESSLPLEQHLQQSLADYGLVLETVRDDLKVITRASQEQDANNPSFVFGFIRDSVTGNPLKNAQISFAGQVSVTSETGAFVLDYPADNADPIVKVTATGYRPLLQATANKTTQSWQRLDLQMTPLPAALDNLIIATSVYSLLPNIDSGAYSIEPSQVKGVPNFGDEPLRTINRFPGLANSGLSGPARIRGGGEDEALVLLDGIPLTDPFHLKDFFRIFSTINQATVERIDYYTGGFPVEFGGRMSGVIDIRTLPANTPEFTEIGLGFFNNYIVSTGQLPDSDSSWLLSARRSGIDLVLDSIESDLGKPRFYDGFFRFNKQINPATSVSVSALVANDAINLSDSNQEQLADSDNRDQFLALALAHRRDRIRARFDLSVSRADGVRRGEILVPDVVVGEVSDERLTNRARLASHWIFDLDDRWQLKWGASYADLSAEYRYQRDVQSIGPLGSISGAEELVAFTADVSPDGQSSDLYFSARRWLSESLSAEAGMRWAKQSYTDTIDDDQFEVRLNARYELSSKTNLRAGWGRFHQPQGIHELEIQDGETRFFQAQLAEHAVAGLDHRWENGLELRLEAYRKRIKHPRPRYENLFDPLVLLPELQPDRVRIAPESAESRGIELLLQRQVNDAFGFSLGYSFSSVKDRINGVDVRRSWDQRHAFNASAYWQWRQWLFGSAVNFHSGWPTTSLTLVESPQGSPQLVAAQRNQLRYESFITLDVRASRSFELPQSRLEVFFELSNAFNAENECCREFQLTVDDNGQRDLIEDTTNWLPVIPSIGLTWRF